MQKPLIRVKVYKAGSLIHQEMKHTFTIEIVGISDQAQLQLSTTVMECIKRADYFAGGLRHFERIKAHLPSDADWTNITIPLENLFNIMNDKRGRWLVFASGDPLFFGIGNTLKRQFPDVKLVVLPCFNALQMLAHRVGSNYGLFKIISLTGRPWRNFDAALINGEERIALLTDRKKTPAAIAERMIQYGYSNYKMTVGECLGGKNERIQSLPVGEVGGKEFQAPNCLLLERTATKIRFRGIPEADFEGLPGRPKMITKMPVRLTTLALMKLQERSVFWDVGACTGSVSIEARLQAPHLEIRGFEIRPESEGIISRNCIRFGVPGIECHICNFLDVDKRMFEQPDAVFLGGYGGQMEQILDEIKRHLAPCGLIAFNAVSQVSEERFLNWARSNDFTITANTGLTVDDNNKIVITVIQAKN